MRIAIEARHLNSSSGGSLQVALGLAAGLSQLTDDESEYHFILARPGGEWLLPSLKGPCRAAWVAAASANEVVTAPVAIKVLKTFLPPSIQKLGRGVRAILQTPLHFHPSRSDGTAEGLKCQLIHFPYQTAYLTDLPTIYHPHDLQHIHLPKNFTYSERRYRDLSYRAFCRAASLVAVSSSWVKRDLVTNYALSPSKIAVIPLAPVNEFYEEPSPSDLEGTQLDLRLPADFILYPAQTWRHKNHIGLIKALGTLQSRGRSDGIHLVFSGVRNEYYETIRQAIDAAQLGSRVSFVDFVTQRQLQCLYKLARCVMIPSMFEAASFPLWEAFRAGVAAGVSSVTSLPEQAGEAALLFDPTDTAAIANVMERLWNEAELRSALIDAGRRSVARYSWRRTALAFRARYRLLLGEHLAEDDRVVLAQPPDL